ncbi:hypothetical protein [Photobacterium leiognathi]|nr:hypothetical protein [Photobacterium leiognathi]
MNTPQTVTLFLFDRFQLLDAFGPLQMFSLLPEFYTPTNGIANRHHGN